MYYPKILVNEGLQYFLLYWKEIVYEEYKPHPPFRPSEMTISDIIENFTKAISFSKKLTRYDKIIQEYENRYNQYKIELLNFELLFTEEIYKSELLALREKFLKKLLKLTKIANIKSRNYLKGKEENFFYKYLKEIFADRIYIDRTIDNFNKSPKSDEGFQIWLQKDESDFRGYIPDFCYIDYENKLCIDIEIDEPYTSRNEPIHISGSDNKRNYYFLDCNWTIIRFSEEQVALYPYSCCLEIALLIYEITLNSIYLQKLNKVNRLVRIKEWKEVDVQKMIKEKYRQLYKIQEHKTYSNIEQLFEKILAARNIIFEIQKSKTNENLHEYKMIINKMKYCGIVKIINYYKDFKRIMFSYEEKIVLDIIIEMIIKIDKINNKAEGILVLVLNNITKEYYNFEEGNYNFEKMYNECQKATVTVLEDRNIYYKDQQYNSIVDVPLKRFLHKIKINEDVNSIL